VTSAYQVRTWRPNSPALFAPLFESMTPRASVNADQNSGDDAFSDIAAYSAVVDRTGRGHRAGLAQRATANKTKAATVIFTVVMVFTGVSVGMPAWCWSGGKILITS
jgi:hypothetical protein